MFLPCEKLGARFICSGICASAESVWTHLLAPTVFNCNAPDSGNMEVIWRYGTDEQKQQWLAPLLEGKIRSVFCMTEPAVASSDATNMEATAVVEGDEIVLNGRKWWSSGLGDPNAKIIIFMAHTQTKTKTVITSILWFWYLLKRLELKLNECCRYLVITMRHMAMVKLALIMSVYPYPILLAVQVKVLKLRKVASGPGRIHHCMRCIGAAEKSLVNHD